jgi:AraC-like DNA-binding protein
VAAELGFTDPYHFSRAFKSVFGVSPTRLVRE